MKKDYIEIAGKKYRVEVNWNALVTFLSAVGRDTLDELSRIDTIRPSELTTLMAACIIEGERLDGRKVEGGTLNFSLDLGSVVTPEDVREFMDIYVRQSNPHRPVDEPKKEERVEQPAP